MNNQNHTPPASDADHERFKQGLAETRWTETGEPYYVIKDGLDLQEFATLT